MEYSWLTRVAGWRANRAPWDASLWRPHPAAFVPWPNPIRSVRFWKTKRFARCSDEFDPHPARSLRVLRAGTHFLTANTPDLTANTHDLTANILGGIRTRGAPAPTCPAPTPHADAADASIAPATTRILHRDIRRSLPSTHIPDPAPHRSPHTGAEAERTPPPPRRARHTR